MSSVKENVDGGAVFMKVAISTKICLPSTIYVGTELRWNLLSASATGYCYREDLHVHLQ